MSDRNVFVTDGERVGTVEDEKAPPLPDVGEDDIDEYLLKRAEADLRRAQARVDAIKQDIAEKVRLRSPK